MATSMKFTSTDSTGTFTIKLEFSGDVQMDNSQVVGLVGLIMQERRERELVDLRFKLESGALYSYRFEVDDGSIWNQTFDFAPPEDPYLDATTGSWQLSRTVAQRPLRDAIVFMRQNLGLVDIKADTSP